MSEENKAKMRRIWEEAMCQRDFRVIDEVVAPNFIEG